MATWQADFDLQLPVEGIAAEFVEELRRILPSTRSWSTKLQVFGEADGHRVDVWSEGGKIIEISMRIDLRHPDRSLFERVLGCLRDAGCSLRSEQGEVVRPELQAFLDALRNSSAFSFVQDPAEFLRRLQRTRE